MEWSKKYVERRGATFPEISGHFGSIGANIKEFLVKNYFRRTEWALDNSP